MGRGVGGRGGSLLEEIAVNRPAISALCCLTLAWTSFAPARAQAQAQDQIVQDPTSRATAVDPPNAVRYTLAEVLGIALANNLDLVSARKDPAIATQQVIVNEAVFDGVLGASADYQKFQQDETGSFTVTGVGTSPVDNNSDTTNWTAGVSWSKNLDFGGDYIVSYQYNDFDGVTQQLNTSSGVPVPENSDSTAKSDGFGLVYRMPLLRGFGREVNQVNVLLAKSGLAISKEELRLQATQTAKQVEDAYWNLLAARAAHAVALESLKLARDLYELNKKKVEVGTLAPIDITQAEAGVAAREETVILDETTVANAEDELRRLLAIPKGDPLWERPIVPTDRPLLEAQTVDDEAAIATALEHRPEMFTARQQVSDSELNERVARNGTRHSLDFRAQINRTSSDDTFQTPNTLSDTKSDRTPWSVGLVYAYPIGNHGAKANYAIATLNREKSQIDLQNAEQTIRVDVRTAARNVESGAKRIAAARANTLLQRKTLEAEQKKFDNGMSTSFEVLRIQTDLSDAQVREIQALLDNAKAVADLERAKGTLLEARGLTIQ
jgi:outer membrane protein